MYSPDMAAKKARGRGGWRPGAGRKPLFESPARITIDMEEGDLDALKELADVKGISAAQLIRNAVQGILKRDRRRK